MRDSSFAASATGPRDAAADRERTFHLGTKAQYLPGVGAARAELLRRLNIRTASDALFFFPRGYEYPAAQQTIIQLREGTPASIVGTVTELELRTRDSGKSVLGVLVENDQGAVRLLFYNQPFRAEQLQRGMRVVVSGTPKLAGLRMEFVHPRVTPLGEEEPAPDGRILPLYPLTDGIKQPQMRRIIGTVAQALAAEVPEVLPESVLQRAAEALGSPLSGITDALTQIHNPTDDAGLQAARGRLIFQELFVLQLALALRRRRLTSDLSAPSLPPTPQIDARIRNRFPFQLTGDQQRVIAEVGRDMARQFPMNRLLQGDVGSGKTVVAQYAMLLAVAHGHQAVMMAPTEVLARQHHGTLTRALAHSRVRVGLLTGSLSATQRRALLDAAQAGEVDVIVGTQALLYGNLSMAKLGLVVIDEQHKFGVDQRRRLRCGGLDPHYLVLSATPIPRTMAMTMFGDLDLSTLREKPPGRGRVHTYLARDGWRDRWWQFVAARLQEGRQAFVVAPRVMQTPSAESAQPSAERETADPPDSDRAIDFEATAELALAAGEDVSAAETIFRQLRDGPLKAFRIDLLHGRMTSAEKEAAMLRFAQGRTQVLVATTVIEVGIDVPNATVMTILGAERFGLAQLHQLRGRVSRGSFAGHVCVFTDAEGLPEENERLRVLAETDDGFALAEADFRLRGPGDLMGTRQSGLPPLRIADPLRDEAVLQIARRLAQDLVDADPHLEAPHFDRLRTQVLRRYGSVLDLGDVA